MMIFSEVLDGQKIGEPNEARPSLRGRGNDFVRHGRSEGHAKLPQAVSDTFTVFHGIKILNNVIISEPQCMHKLHVATQLKMYPFQFLSKSCCEGEEIMT